MTPAILIIEDNPLNFKLAATVLEHAGYRILHASDGNEGIAIARHHKPDLILMDIQLPGMDGLAATRQLKADDDTRGIPIVAVTAFAMAGDGDRIRAAGCDGYIAKPFSYKELVAQVDSVLGTTLRET
jgi:two-component system, cell cycle response regulator DivK